MRVSLPCLAVSVVLLLLAGCAGTPPSVGHVPAARETPSSLSAGQAGDIAIHALGLVGTPYRYGGNTPESGFDCSGLIGYVYRSQSGTASPRTVAQLNGFGQPVEGSELRSGDLVLFGAGRVPTHAGIYVGQGRFVHAPSTGGTVRLDRLDSPYWSRQKTVFRRP